jgi:hypothetical protein
MKTNQQELNLGIMARKKQDNQYTTNKYIGFLQILKDRLNNEEINGLHKEIRLYNISNQWGTFLKHNNIVYRDDNGFYRWNDKIPVSIKLIESFRNYNSKMNIQYTPAAFSKEFKNRIDSKKRIEVQFSDSPLEVIRENHKNTNTQEIGLIRKFLKWIY